MKEFEKSSLRYVNKISPNPEMSHNKILARIKEGANVLEVGPSHGIMTRVLKEDMNCTVHIVEIDEDCFNSAIKYAVDGVCGNIEDVKILDKFQGLQFDYIVFVDVLEHLRNSEEVLSYVKKFLKDDGSVLISVPNIAHNSVIIQLLNNMLIYQDTGLLDYTHVHYFTYNELDKMCMQAGYKVIMVDATYIAVGKNEFDIIYGDVDDEVARYLKERPLGEVYQYIAEIKKQEYVELHNIELENHLGDKPIYSDSENERQKEENPNVLFSTNREIAKLRLELNDAYNALGEKREIKDILDELQKTQVEVKERNNHIAKLDKEIFEKNSYIDTLRENEHRANITFKELAVENEEKERLIETICEEKEKQIGMLQDEKKLLKIEVEKKVGIIKKVKSENKELKSMLEGNTYSEAYVDDLRQVISDKNAQIEKLQEVEKEWENEKNSHAYKKILKKRARRNKIFPKNSKRRLLLDIVYKCYTDPKTMRQILTLHKIKTFFRVLRKDGMGRVNSLLNENIDVAGAKAHPETVSLIAGLEPLINDYSVESFEKLTFTKWNNPLVSIIIPVYNEFNYTYNCLKSILKNSGEVKYEVIIANDCSTDCTSEVESIAENVRLVTTEKNCRFLLNCNNAAKEARGKYILFLNNDTQVRPDWLQPLVDLIESDEKIGMVGSKLIYPDGKLQEAGGILWKDGSAWNYGHRQDPDASEFNYVKEADYISGAAIMIKANLWNEIGGFDELFTPAYCEDSDLAFEVRKHGCKVMYQPKSVVVHFEGVSNGTDTSSGLKKYQVENSNKFCEKWKEVLESEHFENAQNVFQARDKSAKKKCILFIDHYVPQFDKDAGSRTVFAYLKLFVNKGYNVKFLGDNFYRDEPYTEVLQQMGVEVLYGPYYSENWRQWIKENASAFDFVFMNRPHISKKYMAFVRENTKAKIIYYGHDLHYVRERREYELTKNKDLLKSSEDWKKLEYDLMHKADMVYYPSQVEVDEIASMDPSVKAGALTAYIYPEIQEKEYIASDRKNILFVGGFGHGPNVDAVKWFTAEIFPKILQKNPDILFEIVGSKAPDEIKNLASKNIVVHGFVSDEKLAQLYSECKMTVIPLRYGAGIKGKVVEAMSQGVPVVTTSVGAEGILDSGDILFVEDDADKFAELVCDLYDDAESLKKASAKSYKYIEKYYSEDAAWNVIKAEFE